MFYNVTLWIYLNSFLEIVTLSCFIVFDDHLKRANYRKEFRLLIEAIMNYVIPTSVTDIGEI